MPQNARDFGVDEASAAYRMPDVTPAFRLKDAFLWNLHEALIPPDHFAKTLVDELDLPAERKPALITLITAQIRTQLEEYAGVALHPLFHNTTVTTQQGESVPVVQQATEPMEDVASTTAPVNGATPATTNGATNGQGANTPLSVSNGVTATAEPIQPSSDDVYNPDDTYRCIIELTINLSNRLYSDKFEWSLLHPPGFAETFAKQTCADLSLAAEWVPAMAHAIYEAVLRLKKEACENGGLVGYGDIDNDAAEGVEAGWRYEPERLAAEWEPVIENLSKDEIEMREKERERQMRRVRRETARFSSTTNLIGGMPQPGDYFADPAGGETPMGRGERSKKKRRFRSLSPVGRDTPDAGGFGGGGPALSDWYAFCPSYSSKPQLTTSTQGTKLMEMRSLQIMGRSCVGRSRRTRRSTNPLPQLRPHLRARQKTTAVVQGSLRVRKVLCACPIALLCFLFFSYLDAV
jgi:chromatin structure-remodeling complex subunit SFH1